MTPPRRAGLNCAAGAALFSLALTSCNEPSDGAAPKASPAATPSPTDFAPPDVVVLMSFDTTRADHVGAYGAIARATPTLDRLANEGALFEQARAVAPLTMPSHTSMLTGVLPPAHGIRTNGLFELSDQARLVSELFQEAGWRTAAFVGTMILDRRYGLDQGFELYDGPTTERAGDTLNVIERRADVVVERTLQWFTGVKPGERAFLFVHFYDPHAPYEVPHGFEGRFKEAYDAEIAFCDAQLDLLLRGLGADGRNVALVMTSDHGDSLDQHGESTHGIFIYDATAHVPLIVHAPGRVPAARRVSEPVSITDVAPTLLELAGLATDGLAATAARSLLQTIAQPDADRAIYVESLLPFHSYRWHPLQALVWNGWKLIQGRDPQLFRLADDPQEAHDRGPDEPDLVARMQERLRALVAESAALGWQENHSLTDADRAALAKLGYVAGASAEDPFDASLPEPRERIGDLALSMRARELVQQGRVMMGLDPATAASFAALPEATRLQRQEQGRQKLQEARALVAKVRAANPRDGEIDKIEGFLLLTLGDFTAALEAFERLCTSEVAEAGSRFNLALCYQQTGHEEWAVREMMKVVAIEPRFTKAYEWLAQYHGQKGEHARGAFWLQQHAKNAPNAEERRRIDRMLSSVMRELKKRGVAIDVPPDHPLLEKLPEGVLARMRAKEAGGG